MSRKIIFAYAAIFLVSVVFITSFVNPSLTTQPLGFSVAFLPLLMVGLFINWLLRNRAPFARGVFNAFWIMANVFMFAAMGLFGWGLLGAAMTLAAMVFIKAPVKNLPTAPAHAVERAARQEMPWESGRGR